MSMRTQTDEARWCSRIDSVVDFVRDHNRLPSRRTSQDPEERRLGTWLHAQRQNAYAGRMRPVYSTQLDAAVFGWNTWIRRHGTETAPSRITPPVMTASAYLPSRAECSASGAHA